MTSPILPSEVLAKAADLIEPEGAWTTGAYARTRKGNPVGPNTKAACCWCALGAIDRFTDCDWEHPANKFIHRIAPGGIVEINDVEGQAASVAVLRKASELAKAEGQ